MLRAVLVVLLFTTLAFAAEAIVHVNPTSEDGPSCGSAESPCATLRYAFQLHPTGSLKIIAHGLLKGHANRDIVLVEPRNISFVSHDGDSTTNVLDCDGEGRFLTISARRADTARFNVWISGFSIRNCKATPDPGETVADGGVLKVAVAGPTSSIDLQPRIHISNCRFYNNSARYGSVMYMKGNGNLGTQNYDRTGRDDPSVRVLELDNVQFDSNTHASGTIYVMSYRISATKVTISETRSEYISAIFMDGSLGWFDDLSIIHTTSLKYATIVTETSMLSINRLKMERNRCSGFGCMIAQTTGLKLVDAVARNNSASASGFLYAVVSRTLIQGGYFADNIGNLGGGAFSMGDHANFSIVNAVLERNFAGYGGAIYAWANAAAYISNCTFRGNRANAGGAVAGNHALEIFMNDNTLTGNQASQGGGLYCSQSYFNIIRNTFTDNKSDLFCAEDNGATYCRIFGDKDYSSVCANTLMIAPSVHDRNNDGGFEDPLILGLPLWAVILIGTVVVTVVGVGAFVGIVTLVRRRRAKANGGVSLRDPDTADVHQALWTQLPTEADLDDDEGLN